MKVNLIIASLFMATAMFAQKGNIELEPQVGYIHSDIPEYQSGFQVGARASFGLSEGHSLNSIKLAN